MFAMAKFLSGRTSRTLNEFPTVQQSVKADLLAQDWRPQEVLEFVSAHLAVGASEEHGRPIFNDPNAAARYSGGFRAVDYDWLEDDEGFEWQQASVLWDEEGWRGGCGGGIRAWYDLPRTVGDQPVGWTTF